MKFNKNKLKGLIGFMIVLVFYIVLNISLDSYGFFRSHQNLDRFKTYNNVMIDKWMFSFNYIPGNFDGLLIGPAFSSNIDTKNSINDVGVAVYNLSIGSTNFSRIKNLVARISEKKPLKLVIFSIDPYFTMDREDPFFIPDNTMIAYGGLPLLKRYYFELAEKLKDKIIYRSNNYGFVEYAENVSEADQESEVIRSIELVKQGKVSVNFEVSDLMMNDIKSILNLLRKNGTKIVFYFHPRHIVFKEHFSRALNEYKKKISTLLNEKDVLWDFYDTKYNSFLSNNKNYTDIAHLSSQGANKLYSEMLLPELNKILTK